LALSIGGTSMKRFFLFAALSSSLFAQAEPPARVFGVPDVIRSELIFEVIASVKEIGIAKGKATYIIDFADFAHNTPKPLFAAPKASGQTSPVVTGSMNFPYSAVDPVIAPFYGQFPAAAPDPRMIFLDGLGNSMVAVDLTTLSVVSQVVVPSTVGPFGIRPSDTGPSNEVWVANGGLQVTAVDLGAQSVIVNIPTPSIPQSATPAGIVFTSDGASAFEAVSFSSTDSAGNNGALLVFDAVNRKVSSTLLLKDRPTALLIAPDGLTAYLLDDVGKLTYYDVLSGTADLSLSTYPPGSNAGYPGSGSSVFIHPDGTRLFWNVGVFLTIFDLNTHKVTAQVTSGLPTTVGRTMSMSQDGARAYFSDPLGDVVVIDTVYGAILATFNTGAATSALGGIPVAPQNL
jgi:hypothetical protein